MDQNQSLVLKNTSKGQGVFASKYFKEGEKIFGFIGPVLDYDEIKKGSFIDEHCLQIGERTYLGPSGGVDDFFNHSCDPNTGLKEVGENKFALFAIKDIKVGDEVVGDYSTYIEEPGYLMDCVCGSTICRKKIESFSLLPKEIQQKYIELDVVAPFIIKNDN